MFLFGVPFSGFSHQRALQCLQAKNLKWFILLLSTKCVFYPGGGTVCSVLSPLTSLSCVNKSWIVFVQGQHAFQTWLVSSCHQRATLRLLLISGEIRTYFKIALCPEVNFQSLEKGRSSQAPHQWLPWPFDFTKLMKARSRLEYLVIRGLKDARFGEQQTS